MTRGLFLIIILSLVILGFYLVLDENTIKNLLKSSSTDEFLETFKGKIYSSPQGIDFEDFFIDDEGNLYGIEPEKDIEEFKDSNKDVEIEGVVEKDTNDYGEKKIIIKNIKKATETEEIIESQLLDSSCQEQGGSVELRQICIFPNGEKYLIK